MEIREKVFPRKHRDKCRHKRFRSMCSVKKAERKFYAPLFSLNTSSEISFGGTCLYVCAETLSHESPGYSQMF